MIAFVVGLCVLSVVLACLGYEWAGMAIAGIGLVVVLAMARSGWADGMPEEIEGERVGATRRGRELADLPNKGDGRGND